MRLVSGDDLLHRFYVRVSVFHGKRNGGKRRSGFSKSKNSAGSTGVVADARFKMEMEPVERPGVAAESDDIAGLDFIADRDEALGKVRANSFVMPLFSWVMAT